MSKSSIGIAVIGSGRAGMIHARNFAAGIEGAKLVAMVDPVKEARESAMRELGLDRGYADYRHALADPAINAVIVVTPTVFHREIVLAAAAAGRHVLCEKPMAMNASECSDMIQACDSGKVKLQIGFMRRFDRNFAAAKEAITSGSIGDPVLVKSLTRGPSIPQPWMYDIAKSNGPLAEVNSHDIDTVRWFSGSDIVEVYAVAGNYRCPQACDEFPDFYDNVVMTLRFANGMQGCIDGAVSVGYGYDSRAEILGTKGVIHVGALEDGTVSVASSDSGSIRRQAVKSWRNLFTQAYIDEDRAFVRCIQEDSTPEVSGHDGLAAVKTVNAGNESIRTGLPVKIR